MAMKDNRRTNPRHTLEELLALCDPDATISEEGRKWMASPPIGRELI